MERAWVDTKEGRAYASVRFSSSPLGEEVFRDVKDGIRKNVSFGYRYNDIKWIGERDGMDIFSVDDADVLEISFVAIPADFSVGVGRADSDIEESEKSKFLNAIKEGRGEKMGRRVSGGMTDEQEPVTQGRAAVDGSAIRSDEVKEMLAIGREYNVLEMAAEFVSAQRSVDDLRAAILKKIGAAHVQNPSTYKMSERSTLEERDLKKFSLLNSVLAASDPNFRGGGFEREVSEEAKRSRQLAGKPGILIPSDVFADIMKRDALMAAPQGNDKTKGTYAVGTDTWGSEFIRVFYPTSEVLKLGARSLPGLTGNLSIPKQLTSTAAEWVPEGTAPRGSNVTIGQVPMSPKRVATFTEYTRVFLIQSSVAVESFLKDDLQTRIGLAIDYAALNGSGTNNEPLGIMNNPEVPILETEGGVLTFDSIVDMETEIGAANAGGPSMAYLTNSRVRGYLKVVPEGLHIQQRIWTLGDLNTGDGVVNGYRAKVSNQIPGGVGSQRASIIFADWSQVWIGEWGGIYMETNPYIKQGEGIIRLHIEALADVAIRHPESFCVMKNIDVNKYPDLTKPMTGANRVNPGTPPADGGGGGGTGEGTGGGAIRRRSRGGDE